MSYRRTIPAGQALVVYKPCVALYSTLVNTIPHILPTAVMRSQTVNVLTTYFPVSQIFQTT